MPTYYTVIQAVPDPVADERINVGVVVFGDGNIQSRFLRRWDRVRQFAGPEAYQTLRAFAERFGRETAMSAEGEGQEPLTGAFHAGRLNEERLRRMIDGWSNTIRFLPAQRSLEAPEVLLDQLAHTFLREAGERASRPRDRRQAVDLASQTLRDALIQRFDHARAADLVRENFPMAGQVVREHRVDVAVANGSVYAAAEGFSFEVSDLERLEHDIRFSLLAFKDIRDVFRDTRFDLIALPPRKDQATYDQAVKLFADTAETCHRFGASLILEGSAADWATDVAASVPVAALSHLDGLPVLTPSR